MQAELAQSGLALPLERVVDLTHRQLWLYVRQGLLEAGGAGQD